MAMVLRMPQFGEIMESGQEGDPLYEVEIDKATVTVESPASGTLRHRVSAGSSVRVGAEVAEIEA
jgi:pyruvate/2-oxoglutarate dehydrogenase complex dihydrolipoamide acyltransferase (E2) component